jgi:hypothetical protein
MPATATTGCAATPPFGHTATEQLLARTSFEPIGQSRQPATRELPGNPVKGSSTRAQTSPAVTHSPTEGVVTCPQLAGTLEKLAAASPALRAAAVDLETAVHDTV